MPTNDKAQSSSLPNLLRWEKILHRLHVLEDTQEPTIQELELIRRLLGDQPILELVGAVCAYLPKADWVDSVGFFKTVHGKMTLLTCNCSPRMTDYLSTLTVFKNAAGSRRLAQVRLRANDSQRLKIGQEKTLLASTVGEYEDGQLVIWAVIIENPSQNQRHFIDAIIQILKTQLRSLAIRQELDRHKDRLQALTQHLSEGMVVLDRDLIIRLWNRPLQRLTGYAPAEALNRSYAEVLRRHDAAEWLEHLIAESRTSPLRNVFSAEFELLTKQNRPKWVNISGSFLRDKNNEIEQTIIITRDISHLKLLEQRKNEFISIATHELRTPITAIKGYLSLLNKEADQLTDKQRLYLSRTNEANNRLVHLAEDLLQVAQVEEDRIRLNFQPVELYPMLEKICRDWTAKASLKKLKLTVQKPEKDIFVIADREKVEQIFSNLVDNAIKYTNKGSITVTINERGDLSEMITTHVHDTGIGIPGKYNQEIFNKFRRTHRPEQSRESGAGLGLFIVKSLVNKHHGSIQVKSRPGRGSRISVSLPSSPARSSHD